MTEIGYRQDVLGLLQRLGPEDLLVIGESAADLADAFRARHPEREAVAMEVSEDRAALDLERQFDCVLVTDTLEHLPKRAAGILLSRLRDLYARYLLVAVPLGDSGPTQVSRWTERELLAYGLRRLGRYDTLGVYAFDIYDYKLTPDWLNSKYWANPEMWDKYWW